MFLIEFYRLPHKKILTFKIIFVCSIFLFLLSLINIYPQDGAGVNWYYATGNIPFTACSQHTSVVHNDKMWVIGSSSNYVWCSTDGIIWNLTATGIFPIRRKHTSVVYDNKIWVIGGDPFMSDPLNDVWYSADGINWTKAIKDVSFPACYGHTSAVYKSKMWVIGGVSVVPNMTHGKVSDAWYSNDGATWTRATVSFYPPRHDHTSVVFDNKIWVLGGNPSSGNCLNDVWCSTDGVNWILATNKADFRARSRHSSVVYDNKMWVIGGDAENYSSMNDVWYSTDGMTWTQATLSAAFPGRSGHTSVVYDNKMWVIGTNNTTRYRNDVWYSSDGVNWIKATSDAGFGARFELTSIVYDNKMWIIGGNHSGNYLNDVWYSTNGVTWTQATASANFPPRYEHTSLVYAGKMWVIGGQTYYWDYKTLNDVWYSSDGITWTQATVSASFPARISHTSVVYNDKMWVIGGGGNDVWYSPAFTDVDELTFKLYE